MSTTSSLSPSATFAGWLVFGLVTVAASRLGGIAPRLGLPLITGYLFVGALAGPYMLNVVTLATLPSLGFVTQFALAFIAFSAGAELYLPELRALFKQIVYSTTAVALFSFTICGLVIYALASAPGLAPWLGALDPGCRASVAAIAGSIMVARSPASAIAVAKEVRAKGVFTSTLLGVTVLCDVYVLILFTLASTVAESECNGEGFSALSLGAMVGTLAFCCLAGWAVGKLLIGLMVFKRLPTRYLILPLGLAIFMACQALTEYSRLHWPVIINMEPLLLCIIAGYVCTNQSRHRHRFILVLQQAGCV